MLIAVVYFNKGGCSMPTIVSQDFDNVFVDSMNPTINYNYSPDLFIGQHSGNYYRSLFKFDLNALPPGALVTAAYLTLCLTVDISTGLRTSHVLSRALIEDWNANTVNWNTQPRWSTSLKGSTTDVNGKDGSYFAWIITDLVVGWAKGSIPNYGMILMDDATVGGYKVYASTHDNPPASKPVLVIEYTPAPISFVNSKIIGHGVEATQDTPATSDVFQHVNVNTSEKIRANFFVKNEGPFDAVLSVGVSADGINYLQDSPSILHAGELAVFKPSEYAVFTRLSYKSAAPGQSTLLTINYQAQA